MAELNLSIMDRGPDTMTYLKPLLDQFYHQQNIRVNVHLIGWQNGRSELVRYAIYHNAPDVSEVGTTWTSDLIAMNALRPFSPNAIESMTQAGDFLPAAWESTHLAGKTDTVWSIPWLAESILVHYRKDLLAKAGLDPSIAFSTLPQFQKTAEALQAIGIPIPVALPGKNSNTVLLQALASWIWRFGGDFVSTDGKKILFTSPEAYNGMEAFFNLLKTATVEGLQLLDSLDVYGALHQGYAAIGLGALWLRNRTEATRPEIYEQLATARIPGIPFVGGSNLVIWRESRREQAALELVRFLTSPASQIYYGRGAGMLPTRIKTLNLEDYQSDPAAQAMIESLKAGRPFPSVPLWGIVEDRLKMALYQVWMSFMRNPNLNLRETLEQIIGQTAKQLSLTLSQN